MVLTNSKSDEAQGDNEEDGFGILGYSMHSNGGGYDDLTCL